jgi:cytoskeletal protein CcmA (bactofilin family)
MSVFTRNDSNKDSSIRPTTTTTTTDKKPEVPVSTSTPELNRVPQPVQPVSHLTAVQSPSTSVISKALKITGQLESTENIQIDGEVEGDVRGVNVKVGQHAKVKGSVYGDEVELSGTVDGKIEAKKVVLTSSAHMSGDVIHQDITIHSGAYIAGHCRPEFGKTQAVLARPKEVLPRG